MDSFLAERRFAPFLKDLPEEQHAETVRLLARLDGALCLQLEDAMKSLVKLRDDAGRQGFFAGEDAEPRFRLREESGHIRVAVFPSAAGTLMAGALLGGSWSTFVARPQRVTLEQAEGAEFACVPDFVEVAQHLAKALPKSIPQPPVSPKSPPKKMPADAPGFADAISQCRPLTVGLKPENYTARIDPGTEVERD
ncbi:MAG: hypothetical protein WDN72_02080 [Alphaproteobacteria bacterium]